MSCLESENMSVLVIDNGSHTFRAGFCAEDVPSLELPTTLSTRSHVEEDIGDAKPNLGFGADLLNPFESGQVSNWEAMENVWNHIFSKLKAGPAEVPVLLSQPMLSTENAKQKMAEIMFEKFQVPYAHIALQSVLSAYSAGRLSGIVVNSGYHYTDIAVIYEGYLVSNSSSCLNLAGHHITDHLMTKIIESDDALNSHLNSLIVQAVKEQLCYIALNYNEEMDTSLEGMYSLPDGHKVKIKEERFQCPEILFQPFLYGRDVNDPGLQDSIHSVIAQSDIHIRKELYNNVVLCGGNSLLSGFQERLRSEIVSKAPKNAKVTVVASISRKYAVWLGGAVLASLPDFHEISTSKASFEEHGCWKC